MTDTTLHAPAPEKADPPLKPSKLAASDDGDTGRGGFRGFISKYPVVVVLVFAIVGICLGVGFSYWEASDKKATTMKWIGLFGDMFLRALTSIVLPLIFVSVILSVMDMMSIGRASSVGWKTVVLYTTTTVIASVIAVITIVSFKGLFKKGAVPIVEDIEVTLGCPNGEAGSLITQQEDGTLECMVPVGATDDEPLASTLFVFSDTSNVLTVETSGPSADVSLSDTLYDGVFVKLITDNIFLSLNEASFAAVVFFAIFVGVALAQYIRNTPELTVEKSALVKVLKEVEGTLVKLIDWVIMLTPVAVLSLITTALGDQDNLKESFSNVGYLMLASIVAFVAHVLIVHFGMLSIVMRQPSWNFLKYITQAQSLALACASSAATLPVTLKTVKSSGFVPPAVAKFVLPLGATMNMDGSAIYFPCACVWLAVLNGIEPNAGQLILLIIIASVGSAGTAPVPSAALVLIITAYNTVFNTSGTPAGFEFIVAIDWLMDRMITAINVTGDAAVSVMVTKWAKMDEIEDDVEKGVELPIDSSDGSDGETATK